MKSFSDRSWPKGGGSYPPTCVSSQGVKFCVYLQGSFTLGGPRNPFHQNRPQKHNRAIQSHQCRGQGQEIKSWGFTLNVPFDRSEYFLWWMGDLMSPDSDQRPPEALKQRQFRGYSVTDVMPLGLHTLNSFCKAKWQKENTKKNPSPLCEILLSMWSRANMRRPWI